MTGIFLLILILNFFPAKFTLGMGQINNLILLLATVTIYSFYKNEKISGLALSLALSIKIFPVFFLPYFIYLKKWKALFYGLVLVFFVSLLTYFFVKSISIYDYFYRVLPSISLGARDTYYNQSLAGFLVSLFPHGNVDLVRIIIGVILTLGSIFLILRYGRKKVILSFGLLVVLNLLLNTFTWQHHLVWSVVPLLSVFFYIKKNHFKKYYFGVWLIIFALIALNIKNPNDYSRILTMHGFYGLILLYFFIIHLMFKKGIDLDKLSS